MSVLGHAIIKLITIEGRILRGGDIITEECTQLPGGFSVEILWQGKCGMIYSQCLVGRWENPCQSTAPAVNLLLRNGKDVRQSYSNKMWWSSSVPASFIISFSNWNKRMLISNRKTYLNTTLIMVKTLLK